MKSSINEEVKTALETLGVAGTVTLRRITHDRVEVMVNGEYFGTWATDRKTFVD